MIWSSLVLLNFFFSRLLIVVGVSLMVWVVISGMVLFRYLVVLVWIFLVMVLCWLVFIVLGRMMLVWLSNWVVGCLVMVCVRVLMLGCWSLSRWVISFFLVVGVVGVWVLVLVVVINRVRVRVRVCKGFFSMVDGIYIVGVWM